MGEISAQGGGGKGDGKIRAKKQSTKIDMTPMVDLAFLLLTFFILTTTFNKPKTMELTMPDRVKDETEQTKVNENDILNVVLGKDNKVYWWIGLTPPANQTNFSKTGIRRVLLEQSKANQKLMVLIKPQDESKYNNMVDILDEMEITNQKRYAIVDFTPDDRRIIENDLEGFEPQGQ